MLYAYMMVFLTYTMMSLASNTLLFIFPNFYIINLPTIIAIHFLDIIDRLWKAGLLCKNQGIKSGVYQYLVTGIA